MKYAIIGSGEIGTALARVFARKKIEVAIANSRGPATLVSLTEELGPKVVPQSVQDACQAEMIFLAVPFSAHQDVAKRFQHPMNGASPVSGPPAARSVRHRPKEEGRLCPGGTE
ncbi:MAG TPA: NAD(P)-binding domain-containing protein [Chthoniobacterales bacterium]|nr:NAD(P)-binding domain-containing protein [Chthoniobacterales bacterium]